ncbi:MAG: hypothetical protein D6746_06370 [Bacteroidetes bacterium]|nr:MAG: hypothetical protein D6746_06370 [Bacteroidota bacterium]
MNLQRSLALLAVLALVAGCSPGTPLPPPPTDDPTADSAFVLLSSMQRTRLDTAFARLAAYDFTRLDRVVERDARGLRIAFDETIVASDAPASPLRHDHAGTFSRGPFGGWLGGSTTAPPPDPVPYLLDTEPAFLTPRYRDAFTYRLLPDTLLWGRLARVVEVAARPGTEQRLRAARLYLEAETNELIGLRVRREDPALLFRERSRYVLTLRPAGGPDWLPHLFRYHTALVPLFGAPRHFERLVVHYALRPKASGPAMP